MTMTRISLPTPERLDELWTFAGYGSLSPHQPLVAAGDRLLGVAGSNLFALDIFDRGRQRFVARITSRYGGDPYVTTAGGVAYYMDGERLMARRLSDGTAMPWQPPVLSQVNGLTAVGDRIVAVHVGDDGSTNVSAFLATTGARAFGPITISELSPGIVSYGAGAVFFVADGRLHAVNVDFGDARFALTTGGIANEPLSMDAAPCVAAGVVAVVGTKLHLFDVDTGAERFAAIAPATPRAAWSAPIAVDKGQLIIASNTSEVVAVRARDGVVLWRTPVEDAGPPALIPGFVVVTTNRRRTLATLSLADGTVDRLMELPATTSALAPVVMNDTVLLPAANGSIQARSFGRQHAACFDGRASCIDVQPDGEQFDFGVGDFTIEAWIRSSEGGEIVSSYSTLGDAATHGLRLNLGRDGELRVAVVNPRTRTVHAGRTRHTRANDGEWHHVALIRRQGALLALLDGRSHELHFRNDSQAGLDIGGRSALTIGAYRASAADPPQQHFRGLIRELRIWDRALDVATVQNNRHVQLNGNEPRLRGLWSLSEVQQQGAVKEPRNAVERHAARATFTAAASVATDLSLDRSGFPYLLHEIETQWPYAGTWAARGELEAASEAACAANAVAFTTNNAIYGIRRADGRRLWQVDVPGGVSAPVADGAHFLALTGDEGLIAIEALTGRHSRVDSFVGLLRAGAAGLAAPAVSGHYLAAGAPHGAVRIVDRSTAPVAIRDVALGARVRELVFAGARLLVLCGDTALELAVIDAATGAVARHPVSAAPFTLAAEWLFCVRDGRLTRTAVNGQVAVQASIPGRITGLAASADHDLLVVATEQDAVFGLEMADLTVRWKAVLPEGRRRGGNEVRRPTIDHAGRIYCTTSSGTLAVLDPATGARIGLYFNAQSIASPAVLESGTAYFAAEEGADPASFRDGALHSVVLGDTMALRLGLNEAGVPARGSAHALVSYEGDAAAAHTLHHMDGARSCIEAWINLPVTAANTARRPGGGILGISPTDNFGAGMSVDEDGTLHCTIRSRIGGAWQLLRADAPTNINDGAWHHVAVSRDGDEHLTVYVDGVALSDVQLTMSRETPPATVNGIRAYLGAIAGDDLEPARPFCGMLAEVRIWDTYLTPAEISSRMHVKLRGSEPDLVAYWNFDRQNVLDSGLDQHHGRLVATGTEPVWWLTDLPFEKPSYPFITTSTKLMPQEPGQPPVHELTVVVHRADGTGISDHDVELRYVRRRNDDPDRILFDMMPQEPTGVCTLTTGSDGSVTVQLMSTRTDHIPSIDVRAAFMPSNERFHVNLLLNQQTLAAPPPPTLVVQSRLIQDYAHSSGGVINEDRDRSTWRTVIRAVNADGSVRAGEPISLWAGAQLNVEVAGRSWAINGENSAELVTDEQGEIVVVFDAAALNATMLIARAGFMHRNERIQIAPDQDLHRQLRNTEGSTLTERRPTRWKPGMKPGEGEPLLSGDYAEHSDRIADAVSTVMAGAAPAEEQTAPRGRLHSRRLRSTVDADVMRQPSLEVGGDRVAVLRTMSHAPRHAPVDGRRLRGALHGHAGFVFEAVKDAEGRDAVRFDLLRTREQVEAERGRPRLRKVVLGGFFGDLWDTITDIATDIYDGAVKIVVSVAEAVEVAIHKLVDGVLDVVHVVVTSVVEAVNAVGAFFEQIGVMIMKVIEFLRALFDWDAIIRAKNIIRDVMLVSIDIARNSLRADRIEAAFEPLIRAIGIPVEPVGRSLTGLSSSGGEASSPALDEARGVQGQMVMQKTRENPLSAAGSVTAAPALQSAEAAADMFDRLPAILTGIVDLSPEDMVARLLSLVRDGIEASVRLFIRELATISELAGELTTWLVGVLRTEIRVPFLSDLYRWITGNELTLLDLLCLGIAVPVHVAHLAVTTLSGRMSTFADDNRNLVAHLEAIRDGRPLPVRAASPAERALLRSGRPVPPPMDTRVEPFIIALRVINIAAGYGSDSMFATSVSIGGMGAAESGVARVRGIAKVLKGATGITAATLMTYYTQTEYDRRMELGVRPETWDAIKPEPWLKWAILGMQAAGDLITLAGGGAQAFRPPAPKPPVDGVVPADPIDVKEHSVALKARYVCVAAAIVKAGLMGKTAYYLHRNGEDENLIIQNYLFGARDIANALSRAPWYMFTQQGANDAIRLGGANAAGARYRKVVGVRAVLQGISLATHTVAIYPFGTRSS